MTRAPLIIEPGDPLAPGPRALLQASHDLMRAEFPPEDNYFLDFEALKSAHVHFFIARRGDQVLGTGALAEMDGYGGVKSMFCALEARGQGVGDAILRQLEDHARSLGLPLLRLETAERLSAAVRLYSRHGFAPCGRFGDYQPNDTSYFMEKTLTS